MRCVFLFILLCSISAFAPESQAHHGGYHPAWEVDEFADDEAFKAGSAQPAYRHWLAIGAATAAGGLLLIALTRMPKAKSEKAAGSV